MTHDWPPNRAGISMAFRPAGSQSGMPCVLPKYPPYLLRNKEGKKDIFVLTMFLPAIY